MNDFFTTEILQLVGGASVAILGLSAWLGKLWSKRIIQNEKLKLDKELEIAKTINAATLEVTKASLTEQAKLFEHRLNTISQKRFDAIAENYELLADLWLECRWAIQPDELGRDKPPEKDRVIQTASALDKYFKDFERKKLYLSEESQKAVYSFITSVWESLSNLNIYANSNETQEEKLQKLYGSWIDELKPKLDDARKKIESEYKDIIGVNEHNKALQRTSR